MEHEPVSLQAGEFFRHTACLTVAEHYFVSITVIEKAEAEYSMVDSVGGKTQQFAMSDMRGRNSFQNMATSKVTSVLSFI